MKLFTEKHLVFIAVVIYGSSMILVANDPTFTHRWLAFCLHIGSILLILVSYGVSIISKRHIPIATLKKELPPMAILMLLAHIINFLFLSVYPYVSVSDELRDGGLFAMNILAGTVKNIFSYGSYDAHGLIIPTITSVFYYYFGNSVLTYRIPAALFASLDILFLYLLIRLVCNKWIAFWSALVLLCMPLHLFFARTQVVVAFNFFWPPIILLILWKLLKHHRRIDYVMLGTIVGFTFGFHAAVRSFSALVVLMLLCIDCYEIVCRKTTLLNSIRSRIGNIGLLIFFLFVGFGPMLFFTGPKDFFHTSRFSLENTIETNSPITLANLETIKENYVKSLMVYIYEPTTFFYPDHKPIFSPILAILFLLGVGYTIFVAKNYFLRLLLLILLILPFINSAITDSLVADHRLSPLYGISSIFVGIGLFYSYNKIKSHVGKGILLGSMICYLSWQVFAFFFYQPANLQTPMSDYLSMHTMYFLRTATTYHTSPGDALRYATHPSEKLPLCLLVSKTNYEYLGTNVGIQEQGNYLLPKAAISYKEVDQIKDNELYVIQDACNHIPRYYKVTHVVEIACKANHSWDCPIGSKQSLLIHY